MSNFHIQRQIRKWGKNTCVNWRLVNVEKAIIFIHGFQGSSMTTFGDFNLDFRYREEYKDFDVYFYSYDSLFTQIPNISLDLMDFLHVLFTDVPAIISESKSRIARNNYREVVIVAHSLGAVISRYGLSEAYDAGQKWVDKCRLILFAPAHLGARDEIGNFISFPGVLKCLGPLLKYYVVTISQLLDKELVINPLREKYQKLVDQNKVTSFTLARETVLADRERVVINGKYLDSEPTPKRLHTDHVEICKPTRNFSEPFTIVKNVIQP